MVSGSGATSLAALPFTPFISVGSTADLINFLKAGNLSACDGISEHFVSNSA
jgi:hypothetical protein